MIVLPDRLSGVWYCRSAAEEFDREIHRQLFSWRVMLPSERRSGHGLLYPAAGFDPRGMADSPADCNPDGWSLGDIVFLQEGGERLMAPLAADRTSVNCQQGPEFLHGGPVMHTQLLIGPNQV